MRDRFFEKTHCDRCGLPLNGARTMSMFNEDCICMSCANEERKRHDYEKAREAERLAVAQGNRNFVGIGF